MADGASTKGPNDFDTEKVFYFNTHRSLELVKNLENRYKDFSAHVIQEIFKEVLGLEVTNVRPSSNYGTGHVIYFVSAGSQELVFRANTGIEQPEHYMCLEQKFNELYSSAGIPVGTLVHADCSRLKYDFDYQILHVLPGKDLETEWTGSEEEYKKICFQLGQIVAQQYLCPVQGFGRFKKGDDQLRGHYASAFDYVMAYLDYDIAVLKDKSIIDASFADSLTSYFTNLRDFFDKDTQGYLVHHDLADHNIRYSGDSIVAVFDWENAVSFDPISELGSAHTWLSHYQFKREEMVKGFVDKLGYKPENLDKKVSIYFLRTMIWKLSFALRREKFTDRHKQLWQQALAENGLV